MKYWHITDSVQRRNFREQKQFHYQQRNNTPLKGNTVIVGTLEGLYFLSLKLIGSFTINSAEFPSETKAQLVVTMLSDLVDTSQCDVDQLLRFSMTVCKNYRNEPYHNWDHGFSVAHCMYWILKGAPHRFTELEVCVFRLYNVCACSLLFFATEIVSILGCSVS